MYCLDDTTMRVWPTASANISPYCRNVQQDRTRKAVRRHGEHKPKVTPFDVREGFDGRTAPQSFGARQCEKLPRQKLGYR
jgi:hypothetical protein